MPEGCDRVCIRCSENHQASRNLKQAGSVGDPRACQALSADDRANPVYFGGHVQSPWKLRCFLRATTSYPSAAPRTSTLVKMFVLAKESEPAFPALFLRRLRRWSSPQGGPPA